MSNVSIDGLSAAVEKELTTYGEKIIKGLKREARKSMRQLVEDTKGTAPVGHRRAKHYRDSIASKKMDETSRSITLVWYVKGSDYRLSHLLEDGHATRNGGRVEGTHFIRKASVPIIAAYEKAVEEVIRNG